MDASYLIFLRCVVGARKSRGGGLLKYNSQASGLLSGTLIEIKIAEIGFPMDVCQWYPFEAIVGYVILPNVLFYCLQTAVVHF